MKSLGEGLFALGVIALLTALFAVHSTDRAGTEAGAGDQAETMPYWWTIAGSKEDAPLFFLPRKVDATQKYYVVLPLSEAEAQQMLDDGAASALEKSITTPSHSNTNPKDTR